MGCLNEKELSSYMDERLSESERGRIERHLSECGDCMDMLVVAFDSMRHGRKEPGIKARWGKASLKWFLGAVIMLGLSFIFKRFFMQFLIGSTILGFKWAMEGEGAKKAIMIFRGMEKKEKKFERKSPPPVSHIAGGDDYGEER